MRWLPEARRSLEAGDGVSAVIALAIIIAGISSIFLYRIIPFPSAIIYGVLPQIVFCIVGLTFIMSFIGRERLGVSLSRSTWITGAALALSLALSFLPIWVHSISSPIFTPFEVLLSIVTVGILPHTASIFFLTRFLPILTSVGLFIFFVSRVSIVRAIVGSVAWYLVCFFLLSGLSWIGGVVTHASGSAVLSTEMFGALVTMQRDGYWTMLQQNRFFAPIGYQTDVSFMAIEASILTIASALALATLAWIRITGSAVLMKRFATRTVGAFAIVAIAGLTAATIDRLPHASITDAFAQVIFLLVLGSWLVWWRMQRDLDHVSIDLETRPSLPLPSGEASTKDVGQLAVCAIAFALYGAALLGWPVFLPFAAATAMAWIARRHGAGWGSGILGVSVFFVVISLFLGWAGLEVGLRQLTATPAMTLIILSCALFVGIGELFYRFRDAVDARFPVMILLLTLCVLSLLVARQSFLLYLLVPFVSAWIWIIHKPSTWYRFGAYPIYGLLIGIVCIELFFPHLLTLLVV